MFTLSFSSSNITSAICASRRASWAWATSFLSFSRLSRRFPVSSDSTASERACSSTLDSVSQRFALRSSSSTKRISETRCTSSNFSRIWLEKSFTDKISRFRSSSTFWSDTISSRFAFSKSARSSSCSFSRSARSLAVLATTSRSLLVNRDSTSSRFS